MAVWLQPTQLQAVAFLHLRAIFCLGWFPLESKDATFNDPKLAINKVYTKTGDKGTTSLVGGQRVPKHAARIEAYGTVDELNSYIGLIRDLYSSVCLTYFFF